MKRIADVIAELTKAADNVQALSEGEKLRLLGRAYVTIKEGWDMLGQPGHLQDSAEAMDLIQAGGMPLHLYDDEMKAILLEAAKVIRQIEAAMTEENSAGTGKMPAADRR